MLIPVVELLILVTQCIFITKSATKHIKLEKSINNAGNVITARTDVATMRFALLYQVI